MRGRVVVLGGGINGLVAATKLARRGLQVSLCEARSVFGGLAAGEEFQPTFQSSGLLHDGGVFAAEIARELELANHGLRWHSKISRYAAQVGAPGIWLHEDAQRTAQGLRAFSTRDAASYLEWRAFLQRVEPFVRELLRQALPPLEPNKAADYWELLQRGLRVRRLGEKDLLELLRVLPMSVADWLGDLFESPALQAALAAPALEASWLSPYEAGSSAALLVRECTREQDVVGGPASIVRALLEAARRAEVTLHKEAQATRIRLRNGRVQAVVLASGKDLAADYVLSTLTPKQTFGELLGPQEVDQELLRSLAAWRARGTSAKLHLALAGELDLPGHAAERVEHWTSAASLEELEASHRPLKYGAMSERPLLDVRVHSYRDPSLAPAGKHVVSILVQGVPYDLSGGWTALAKAELEKRVLGLLEEHAPGTHKRILACQTLTPLEIEQRYRLHGGHLHHGEFALDQWLYQRPSLSLAQHSSVIPGLYLGGASQHPGGGPNGVPGALAAERLLSAL